MCASPCSSPSTTPAKRTCMHDITDYVYRTLVSTFMTYYIIMRVVCMCIFIQCTATQHKKIIFFLHLHKSAGSSLCRMASVNKMKVDTRNNCNVQNDQRCCGGENIADQQRFALSTKYDFVANEGYMYEQMDMTFYTYITILRRSISRYHSHYHYVLRYSSHRNLDISFENWLAGQPDNWNVRHICGTRCMHKPKYSLNVHDFLFTAQRLKLFSHILFFEKIDEGSRVLANHFGWSSNVNPHLNKVKQSGQLETEQTSLVQKSNYLKMSFMDDLLYDYALNNNLSNIPMDFVDNLINKTLSSEPHSNSPCGQSCSSVYEHTMVNGKGVYLHKYR